MDEEAEGLDGQDDVGYDSGDPDEEYEGHEGIDAVGDMYCAGGEDMYGGGPESAVAEDLTGTSLQTAAENAILNVLLRRCDILAPSAWQGVVHANNSDPMIPLTHFATAWSRMQKPLTDSEIMALFARFGSPNDSLCEDLARARGSKVNRTYLHNQGWKNYSSKSVKEQFTSFAVINQTLLYDFISFWENTLNLIEIQISRADNRGMEADLHRGLKEKTLNSLLTQLGVTGVTVQQIQPIILNALQLHNISDGLTLLDLLTYCRARAARLGDNGERAPMCLEFDFLLRPIANSSSSRAPKNLLSILSNISDDSSSGEKSSRNFLASLKLNYPNIQPSLLEAITHCITNKRKNDHKNINPNQTISLRVLETFCFPQGFSVSVLMPLGSFKAKNSKIKPLDSTEKLYILARKQLFFNLRKHKHSDPSLRVPDDLQLYADKALTALVPDSDKIKVISVIDNNTKLYGKSEYVTEILEQEKYEILRMDVLEENLRQVFETELVSEAGGIVGRSKGSKNVSAPGRPGGDC